MQKRITEKVYVIVTAVTRWVTGSFAAVAAGILLIWVLVMTVGILGRSFLGWSWMFLEEYTSYLYLVMGCFGFAYAAVKGAHVKVDVLVARLPNQARVILECLSLAIYIWFAILLTLRTSRWVLDAIRIGSISPDTRIPLWIPYLIPVLGFGSLALASLYLFLCVMRDTFHRESRGNGGVGELDKNG